MVRWLKAPGERVERFEPIVEVLTDKVTVELPSPVAGVLAEIRVREGETVPVGTVLAVLEPFGPARPGRPDGEELLPAAGPAREPRQPPAADRGLYSPAVRRLARELGVELASVRGTGPAGRVTQEDVRKAAGALAPAPPAAGAAVGPEYELVELSPTRSVVARRMAESWAAVPHAWTMVEADVTALAELRAHVAEGFCEREGFELTYLPFAVKAAADALREHPELNASWFDGQVRRHRRVHIGVAMGLEEGLVVPVVRDADRLSVTAIARLLHELVGRARAGELSPDQLQGATFTVNNTGALGSVLSGPIVPLPQAAVLTTEAVTRRLVVLKEDHLAIRSIMNLCLAFDHRVADGLHALRLLKAVRLNLEAYGPGSPLT